VVDVDLDGGDGEGGAGAEDVSAGDELLAGASAKNLACAQR